MSLPFLSLALSHLNHRTWEMTHAMADIIMNTVNYNYKNQDEGKVMQRLFVVVFVSLSHTPLTVLLWQLCNAMFLMAHLKLNLSQLIAQNAYIHTQIVEMIHRLFFCLFFRCCWRLHKLSTQIFFFPFAFTEQNNFTEKKMEKSWKLNFTPGLSELCWLKDEDLLFKQKSIK